MMAFVFLAVVQFIDVAVHVAAGHVEVLRLLASAALLAGAAMLQMRSGATARALLIGGGAYLALNLVFLAQNGLTNPETDALRIPLFGFVAVSLAIAVWQWRAAAR